MSDKLTIQEIKSLVERFPDSTISNMATEILEFRNGQQWLDMVTKPIEPNPHAALIAQCEDDKLSYPDFWCKLWQIKLPTYGNWAAITGVASIDSSLEKRQHPHRARIIEFHQCSDEDKLRWQWRNIGGVAWFAIQEHKQPFWSELKEYRIRPKICQVTINGKVLEYPEPVRETLSDEQGYFLVDAINGITRCFWDSESSKHYTRLDAGLIQITQEGAEQHMIVLKAVNAQVAL